MTVSTAASGVLAIEPAPGINIAVTTNQATQAKGQFGFNLATHVEDDLSEVQHNRKILSEYLKPLPEPIWLEQYHGDQILSFEQSPNTVPRADGSFTQRFNLPLAILTADCLPVVLWSQEGIAVVHAGWRGLANGILGNALARFSEPVTAWLGPAISACHYEVDEAVAEYFRASPALKPTPNKTGHYQFALNQEATRQLQAGGVQRVMDLAICTGCDDRFYSHRMNGPTGRFATLAWRTEVVG